jgi:uncharacterized protein with FMN-binding domain
MPSKMPRRLVALSSSAIATIYFAGFVATRAADAGLAAASAETSAPVVASASPTAVISTTAPTPVVSASASATTSTATSASTSASTTATAAYKDGTYTGQGTSRRGGVSVSVTIQGGRIQNVTITGVTTEYPVSRIASLPAEVVARQSAQVDRVSGATYSTQAFQQAVQQALAKAA